MRKQLLSRAVSALQWVDADKREHWLRAAMALRGTFGEEAFPAWDAWSQTSESYNLRDARAVWRSCKTGGAVGLGTLFYLAKSAGWAGDSGEYYRPHVLPLPVVLPQHESDQQFMLSQASELAKKLWSQTIKADPDHQYLQRKKIFPIDCRQLGETLVLPITDGEKLVNLQRITGKGSKRFLRNGRVSGAYVHLKPEKQVSEALYLVEGWATGVTVLQATGAEVFCAMSAHNLMAVARKARRFFPDRHIVVAGDNDHYTPGNPGATAARKVAISVGGELLLPEFSENSTGTDWNDFYLESCGGEA